MDPNRRITLVARPPAILVLNDVGRCADHTLRDLDRGFLGAILDVAARVRHREPGERDAAPGRHTVADLGAVAREVQLAKAGGVLVGVPRVPPALLKEDPWRGA